MVRDSHPCVERQIEPCADRLRELYGDDALARAEAAWSEELSRGDLELAAEWQTVVDELSRFSQRDDSEDWMETFEAMRREPRKPNDHDLLFWLQPATT